VCECSRLFYSSLGGVRGAGGRGDDEDEGG
jgi:hypothetical protein